MKKIVISLSLLSFIVWPLSSSAIGFSNLEISSVVKITSKFSKETIDKMVRSTVGDLTPDQAGDYRKQLEAETQIGSGFFVTYSGCAITTKHAVYDVDVSKANANIHLWQTFDAAKAPVDLGEATIVYVRTVDDIALVCLNDSGGRFFQKAFTKTDDYKNLTLSLGEKIYTFGYPVNGGKTLTVTSGIISGTWDENTFKTDMKITAGASGSPIFNEQKQIIGIAEANTGYLDQLGIFMKPDFVLDWLAGYKDVYRSELLKESGNCVDSMNPDLYAKDGQEYYDLSCTIKRDLGLEAKLIGEYKNVCSPRFAGEAGKKSPLLSDIISASSYIKSGQSSLDYWTAYLEESCLSFKPAKLWPMDKVE